MPRIICPDCDEKVSYAEGKRFAKCPACGSKIELERSDDGDEREEEDEERPQKKAAKKPKKKAKKPKPVSGRIPLIVIAPVCIVLMAWAPFSGYGTALSMVAGGFLSIGVAAVLGVKLYRDPEWCDESSSLAVRLFPILLLPILIRAASSEPRKYRAWVILLGVTLLTTTVGITVQAVWKTMDAGPPKNGAPAGGSQPGRPGQQPAGPPPAPKETDDDIVNKVLAELDKTERIDWWTVDRLNQVKSNERRPEVSQKLSALLESTDNGTRVEAIKRLGLWGGPADVPALISLLDHKDGGTQEAAMRALGSLHDPRAIAPLIARIKGNRTAQEALRKLGSAAEPDLIPLLEPSVDPFLQQAAIRVLQDVGTSASVPALQKVVANPTGVRIQEAGSAKEALKAINARARKK
jgi:hypothetical protein